MEVCLEFFNFLYVKMSESQKSRWCNIQRLYGLWFSSHDNFTRRMVTDVLCQLLASFIWRSSLSNSFAEAEKVVGWAKNHYLSSCNLPLIKGERLYLPRERYRFFSSLKLFGFLQPWSWLLFFCVWSLETAILRLKEQEAISRKPSQGLKACFINYHPNRNVKWLCILCTPLTHKWWQNIAKDEYESNFISAVVPPGEIGVKFDDIGALEDVKKALNELVILPMRRPELFSHGNLLRVLICSFYAFWSGLDGICGVLFP